MAQLLDRTRRTLLAISAVLFVAVLFVCCFLPVYMDEIEFKLLHARYFNDLGQFITLIPECSSSYHRHPWPIFLPFRLLDALFFGDLASLWKLRAAGVLFFILWIFSFTGIANRINRRPIFHFAGLADVLPWFTLGVVPLLLVLNRPEQLLVTSLALAIGACLFSDRLGADAKLTLFVVACIGGFSYHFTMVPFAPVWIVVALRLWKDRARRAVALLAVAAGAAGALGFALGGNTCPEFPSTQIYAHMLILDPSLLFTSPLLFFSRLWSGLSGFFTNLEFIFFREAYQATWLPPSGEPLSALELALNGGIVVAILSGLAVTLASLWARVRERSKNADERFRLLTGAALFFGCLALVGLETSKLFYRDILFIPVFILAGILTFRTPPKKARVLAAGLQCALLLLSCLSETALISRFIGSALGDWSRPGPTPRQEFSVNHVGYGEVAAEIRELAARCGIGNSVESKHVIVDDSTYPALDLTFEPYVLVYLFNWGSMTPPLTYMKNHETAGLVTSCRSLSARDRALAVQHGDFCCVRALR